MTIEEFRTQILAEREAQRKENLAKSQAFLASISKEDK